MNHFRVLAPVLACFIALGMSSCMTTGGADAVNPTVGELDRLDQQWGLAKREPRGTPKRVMRYPAAGQAAPSAPAQTVRPATPAAAAPTPAAPAQPQLDPGLIDSLR